MTTAKDKALLDKVRELLPQIEPYGDNWSYSHGSVHMDCGSRVLDVRGWGYLTGRGSGALGIPMEEAANVQDAMGKFLALLPQLAALTIRLAEENERLREALNVVDIHLARCLSPYEMVTEPEVKRTASTVKQALNTNNGGDDAA